MNIKMYLLLAMPLLAACENSDSLGNESGGKNFPSDGGDIRFEVRINSDATRVTTTDDFKSAFVDGDAIGLYAVKHKPDVPGVLQADGSNYINNVKLTYSGGTWSIDNGGEPLWYPNDGSILSFYACYPYNTNATDPTRIAFALSTNQSESDAFDTNHLLAATPVTCAKGEAVQLSMNHLTTWVQVELENSSGAIDRNATLRVFLSGVKQTGTIDLNASTTPDVLNLTGSAVSVIMQRVEAEPKAPTYTYRALVPAQTITNAANLLRIHNGSVQWSSKKLNEDITLKAGKVKKHQQVLPFTIHTEYIDGGTFKQGDEDIYEYYNNENSKYDAPLRYTGLSTFDVSKYEITNIQYCVFLNAFPHTVEGTGLEAIARANANMDVISWYYREDVDYSEKLLASASSYTIQYVDNKWVPVSGYEQHPVSLVTWYGAIAFCQWAGGRLPTEAEWEYICRAGSKQGYGMGAGGVQITEANLRDYEWIPNMTQGLLCNEVGTGLPNAWGLYDMHGNAAEWCYDWYDEDYNVYSGGGGSVVDEDGVVHRYILNPVNFTPGSKRVIRGAHWISDILYSRSGYRSNNHPHSCDWTTGFRIVFPRK